MNPVPRACVIALVLLGLVPEARAQSIPAHPRDLTFPPLVYTPPERSAHRVVLANGTAAYFAEDRTLPLVQISVLLRVGRYLDPPEKRGLAAAVGSLMRAGGAGPYVPDAFDDELAFLAATLSSGIGDTSGQVSTSFLAKDTDQALRLLFLMLRDPRFDVSRLDLHRTQALQQMARRNDDTEGIEQREWLRLLRGPAHFTAQFSTKESIDRLTRDDLVAFHQRHVHPGAMVLAVAGDFDRPTMIRKLNEAMRNWAPAAAPPPVPPLEYRPEPGVYLVHKAGVNQGRVSIGHPGLRRGHPDEIAVDIMNDVLGGSGFTSRIMSRVRTEEGLAYAAGSSFTFGTYYPGWFRAEFQSKSGSVARAARLVVTEIARMRNEPVSAEELHTVKSQAIEVFPRYFSSAGAVAGTFASDELTGRDPAFWRTYRDRVAAVTVDDVRRVAREHLDPARLVLLIVGDVDAITAGDPAHPDETLAALAGARPIRRIALPDPLTMTYPPGGPAPQAGARLEPGAHLRARPRS